ncbi:MAG: hypothetical protein KA953_00580 [Lachnospiraceae bacterium]|nr:hypothetical protein [Lachnospiraceae bacterium]
MRNAWQTRIGFTSKSGKVYRATFSNEITGKIRVQIGTVDILFDSDELKDMIEKFTDNSNECYKEKE